MEKQENGKWKGWNENKKWTKKEVRGLSESRWISIQDGDAVWSVEFKTRLKPVSKGLNQIKMVLENILLKLISGHGTK